MPSSDSAAGEAVAVVEADDTETDGAVEGAHSKAFAAAADIRQGVVSAEEAALRLLQELTRDERLRLLDGDEDFWTGLRDMLASGYNRTPYVHGAIDRLGIPGLRFSDGPRGVVMGSSTAFPVSMARGATWDTELEERVGDAIGKEVRAQGGNFFGGVCVNLPRHPAWGRAQETYGEDPVLLGALGVALTRGVQRHVMACVKHFALNSMENARFTVDVRIDEATLHEVYLPHFRAVVEAGVAGVMSAYNSVNGEWAGQNRALLTGILRDEWGFEGVTVSDFFYGLRDAAASLSAGLDVEEPFAQQRAQHLPADLASGRACWEHVDRAALRILTTQLRFAARHDTLPAPDPSVVACAEHRELARTVAARSIVVLRNETVEVRPLLPLDATRLRRLAVIGHLADLPNTGEHGSSDVRPPEVVTVLAGLRAALPGVQVVHEPGDDPQAAVRVAAGADAAIVIAGYTAADEGEYISGDMFSRPELARLSPPSEGSQAAAELASVLAGGGRPAEPAGANLVGSTGMGGDRERLTLRPEEENLILAVTRANPRTVVGIVAAGAVLMERWRHSVPAIAMLWYAGMEGGHAFADVLLGRHDATGRLPFSVPTDEAHLPDFDRDATVAHYDRWHGQRLLDRRGLEPAFPLGFGLSYTTFDLTDAAAEASEDDVLTVSVLVTNTGARPGSQVVQIYGAREDGTNDDAVPALLGFTRLDLDAGETQRACVTASLRPLSRRDPATHTWIAPTGAYRIEAAAHYGDPHAACVRVRLG
ncbi:beta-glucosidase family protein [Streptomyces albicerus]|uniref:beta-glucosidase family protein n=1 Tax=Streptomyces albicerus TaxID=2569859 RepID=UPI00124B4AE1|nr:glycoside hydrolase family 3 N-terminal domain-containing protein [Streptomyces albicerus]